MAKELEKVYHQTVKKVTEDYESLNFNTAISAMMVFINACYKESVLPKSIRARVAVEAGSTYSWYKYVGLDGEVIGIDHFGASAPAKELFNKYGFTVENVVEKALKVLNK